LPADLGAEAEMMCDVERAVKPIESDRSCPHCGDRQLERVSNALWRSEICSATFPIGPDVRPNGGNGSGGERVYRG
jgi:ribosomal protein L37AE/L43A